jgi:hypothetical protein
MLVAEWRDATIHYRHQRRPLVHNLLALLLVASLTVPAADLRGPVRLWTFDDGDAPWTSAGISFVSAQLTTVRGWSGSAARFEGKGGLRLDVGEEAFRDGLTVSLLVRPDAEQVATGPVNLVSCPGRFMLRIDPEHRGREVSLFLFRGGKWEPRVSAPALTPDTWSQIIAVATPGYAYMWVNGCEYRAARAGEPTAASGPLIVGGALPEPVSAAPFSGCMDQLELREGPVGRQWIFERALWPTGMPDTRRSVAVTFSFPKDAKGWTGLWGATAKPIDAALRLDLPRPSARWVSPPLQIPLAEEDGLQVELATRASSVGEVFLYGEKGFQEKRFRIIPDGQMHRYPVPVDMARLHGTVAGLSLRLPKADNAQVDLRGISFGPLSENAAPAIVLRAFAPEHRWARPGEPIVVHALLANAGLGEGQAKLTLHAPLRAERPEQALRLAPGSERDVQWRLTPDKTGRCELRLSVLCPDLRPFHAVSELIVQEQRPPLPILREGYPRAMDFRHLGPKNLDIQSVQSMLLVDLIGDKIEAARAFKKRYPDTCVLMQINDEPNGLWGTWFTVPREYALKEGIRCEPEVFPMPEFKGYWLLRPGAELSVDFAAGQAKLVLPVPDPSRFLHRRFGGKGDSPHDALVYPTGAHGPDWPNAEYVSITAVDVEAKTITVERWPKRAVGVWHGFRAGAARIAPSAGDIYRHRTWIPNLTKFCPRDPETGMDACEWWARHFARLWHRRIAKDSPHPDGFQFDWAPFHAHKRDADCDLDGQPDGGDFDGISYWGLGMHRFFSLLRSGGDGWEGVGDDVLLAADASNTAGQRSFSLLNGSENEEFCGFGRPHAFSSQFDLYSLWCRNARTPRVSYLQSRFPCDLYFGGDFDRASRRDNFAPVSKIRLALAAACMELGIHTYRPGGRQDIRDIDQSVTRRYDLDEYQAGREGRFNWLGKPLGKAERVPEARQGAAILRADFQQGTDGWELGKCSPAVETERPARDIRGGQPALRFGATALRGPRLRSDAAQILSPWSKNETTKGQEVTFSCRIAANPQFDEREGPLYAGIPRELSVALESEDGARTDEAEILVGEDARDITLTFLVPGTGKLRVACGFGADLGPVWLSHVLLRPGCGDVMVRRFENGIVRLNGSPSTPFSFDTHRLDGRPLAELDGLLSPLENQGRAIDTPVRVSPRDARFLRTR